MGDPLTEGKRSKEWVRSDRGGKREEDSESQGMKRNDLYQTGRSTVSRKRG